jgi:prepilin peptidase CpaA
LDVFRSTGVVCLLVFLAVAALVDLHTRRIPNLLTIAAALVGLLLNVLRSGGPGALACGAGLLTGFATFLPFYLARGFGAGDVKAMAAVGAFLGPKGALLAAAWTLGVGGLGALLMLATLRWQAARTGRGWQLRDACRQHFPYGLAIACGTALSLPWS